MIDQMGLLPIFQISTVHDSHYTLLKYTYILFISTSIGTEILSLKGMEEELDIIGALIPIIPDIIRADKNRQHTSILTGKMYCEELMTTQNENRFINATRMKKDTFKVLIQILCDHGGLKDSIFLNSSEKLMILLYILQGQSIRKTSERFQHSTSTIHAVIREVISSLQKIHPMILTRFSNHDTIPESIRRNTKFYPYFKNCIGAIDGTHISVSVPSCDSIRYRNRKGFLSQNVLGVVDFNMIITYSLAGWEGSAHDSRVLNDALTKGLPRPIGKYYLGDAGYALRDYCLTPYRGVRYHLKEWGLAPFRPRTKEELFNLRHAMLRNIVERVFGVLKKRFPILNNMPNYPLEIQTDLIYSTFIVNNVIRIYQNSNDLFDNQYIPEDDIDENDQMFAPPMEPHGRLTQWRDQIAEQMWRDYERGHVREDM
jgi:DDE superfamily endonuclease